VPEGGENLRELKLGQWGLGGLRAGSKLRLFTDGPYWSFQSTGGAGSKGIWIRIL